MFNNCTGCTVANGRLKAQRFHSPNESTQPGAPEFIHEVQVHMKTPAGQDEYVLYLDFDGVLHHEDCWWHPRKGPYLHQTGYQLFQHVGLLEETLAPYPQVKIVLSTSWVRRVG